jgi:hypothetical protein
VIEALGEAGPLLAERLLGALELTIGELGLTGAAGVPLGEPPTGRFASFAFVHNGGESQAEAATALLKQFHPGALDLATSLTRRLAGHELVAPLLAVAPDVTGEMPIAAAHGTGYLALAVATASAVIGESQLPLTDSPAAAVVGVALGVALLLLASVSGHRFALAEGQVPDTADFSGNGLVAVVPGGVVIRTGVGEGSVAARLNVPADEPPLEETGWDEIVEVSWRAAAGQARLNPQFSDLDVLATTPPWPGDYRLRVHATGRDGAGCPSRRTARCSRRSSPASSRPTRRRPCPRSPRPCAAWTSTTTGTRPGRAWSRCGASPAAASPPRNWSGSRRPTSRSGSPPGNKCMSAPCGNGLRPENRAPTACNRKSLEIGRISFTSP